MKNVTDPIEKKKNNYNNQFKYEKNETKPYSFVKFTLTRHGQQLCQCVCYR